MFWGEDNGFVQPSQTSSSVRASKHRASASGILCSEGDPTKVVSGWSQGSAFSFVCVCVYVFQHESWTARLYNELVSQLSGKGRGGNWMPSTAQIPTSNTAPTARIFMMFFCSAKPWFCSCHDLHTRKRSDLVYLTAPPQPQLYFHQCIPVPRLSNEAQH